MTAAQRGRSRNRLVMALSIGAVVLLCLCLVVGVGAGAGMYLMRSQAPAAAKAAVEYIMDASPRMELPGESGAPRLEVARAVLAEIVRPSDPALMTGLRVFGTGALTQKCQDTNLLVPLALSAQPLISSKITSLTAGQSTDSALAQAIVAAIRDLAAQKSGPHSLVVVTGGADSCNPEADKVVAAEAQRAGIELNTYVVGYGVTDTEAEAIKVIVDQAPHGRFMNAKNETELRTTLKEVQTQVEAPAGGSPLKIALVMQGAPDEKGAQLAVDAWNAKGGVLGRKIELVAEDTQDKTDVASAAAKKVIEQDQAQYIIGDWNLEASSAIAGIAETHGAVNLSLMSSQYLRHRHIGSALTLQADGSVRPYIFTAGFDETSASGTLIANFALSQGYQTAFILVDSANILAFEGEDFAAAFQQGGGQVVGQATYAHSLKDFSTLLEQAAQSQATVVYLAEETGDNVNLVAQQAKAKGLTAVLMGDWAWGNPGIDLKAIDGGFYVPSDISVDDPRPAVKTFVAAYRQKYLKAPIQVYFAGLPYDAVNLMLTAIQQAGADDPAQVKDVLAGLCLEGVTGQLSFDVQHNRVYGSPTLMQVKDGQKIVAGAANLPACQAGQPPATVPPAAAAKTPATAEPPTAIVTPQKVIPVTPVPGQEIILVDVGSVLGTKDKPTAPTTFTSKEPWHLTTITTYHYHGGQGAPLGTIKLKAADGTVYGPWPMSGVDGQGGVKNAFWVATTNSTLPPGTYTVVDSDPATWSYASDTNGRGITWIRGWRLAALPAAP